MSELIVRTLVLLVWVGLVTIPLPMVLAHISRKAASTRTKVDDLLFRALRLPLVLALVGTGLLVYIGYLPISARLHTYLRAGLIVLFVYCALLFFDRLIIGLLKDYSTKVAFVESSAGVLKTLFRLTIFGVAVLIVLDTLGISITPLIASLGVGSLAIALALQGTLSNLFAGLYLMVDKPVRVGDYIKLETGEEGYVNRIGWRSTRIRMLPNNMVVIPNSKLAETQITNFYFPEQEMSALVQVGVSYESDLEKVEEVTIDVAKKVLKDVSGGVEGFAPFIRYHTFSDFSIDFTVILRVKEYVDKYLITHEFMKALHRRYGEEGIVIPFPIRTVHLDRGIGLQSREEYESTRGNQGT
jgi:small-conductance mechanosensitive channel